MQLLLVGKGTLDLLMGPWRKYQQTHFHRLKNHPLGDFASELRLRCWRDLLWMVEIARPGRMLALDGWKGLKVSEQQTILPYYMP